MIGRSHLNPLVGRESELGTLRQFLFAPKHGTRWGGGSGWVERGPLWPPAAGQKEVSAIPFDTQRRPQCVVLMGEAGIGKTRLAEEVSREAQGRSWAVVWSRSYAQESNIPYRLWIEVLRNVMQAGLWPDEELHKHPLIYTRLAALLPELYEQLPQVTSSSILSAEQEQQSLWEAVLELVKSVIERTPLLVVLDDLQWADASSCDLLAYLVRRLSGSSILFLGTCRESELPPRHPLRSLIAHMQREHTITTLQLQPLSDAAIGALIAHSQLPDVIVRYIQTQAAGNPFFAEELAYSYNIELPITARNRPQATRKRRSSLPRSIAAALDQRISKLSRNCQQLLSSAAVLGGSFEFSLIRSMETSDTTPADEDSMLDLLDEALQAGVLTEEGRGARIRYHFWQPLMVSHLYDGLSATRRALLHRRAAEVLQRFYMAREAEGAATITHHLVEGGAEPQQIAHYAELAGNYAYALSAYPEAERYYRLAIEPSSVGARFIGPLGEGHLAYLLEQLGECLRIQGNYADARRIYEQVLQERSRNIVEAGLAPSLGEGHSDRAGSDQEAQVDALLWSEVAWTWYYAGDYTHTRQYAERGEQVLRKTGVVAGPAWARLYFLQSYILWQEGNYDKARSAASEALRLFEEHLAIEPVGARFIATTADLPAPTMTRLRRTLAGDPVDLARTHRLLGALANSVGQLTEALTHFNTALAILEQHDHKREIAHVCCNMGYIHLQKAEHELAQVFLHRSLSLAEQIGDIPLTAVVFSNLGRLTAHKGDLADAENWYKRGLALAEQTNDQVYMSMWNVELAAVFQDQGQLSEAGACILHALTIGRAMHNAPCIGLALVAQGYLRIEQAKQVCEVQVARGKDSTVATPHSSEHYLERANKTLQRALAFDKLEAEARNRGQLASAEVSLLLGDAETARVQALHALKKARKYELTWLVSRAQLLLGRILAAQGQQHEAVENFEHALQAFRTYGMRLEYARTLQRYGAILLQTDAPEGQSHLQALNYLFKAREIFSACRAMLDLQRVEQILSTQT